MHSDTRKCLGGAKKEPEGGGDFPTFIPMEPFGDRPDLPPDPGYTGTPNESLANTRSRGRLATADMIPDNGGGDIKEGVSFRTRMAGQAPSTFHEDDSNG